ncbi:MAG: cupin domain-containing protein [Verrucomicrobiota bacterium JB022]|nr:cupin domain-containing protein [Verrucomicrobiota bacterium JB022]
MPSAAPDYATLPAAAQRWARQLQLQPIPHEGAWFAPGCRTAHYSTIYGLVTTQDFSALHRLKCDELWFYHAGSPIELLLLHPNGEGEKAILGPDLAAGQRPQLQVPAGTWMGGRPVGTGDDGWSVFSNAVIPAFEYDAYEPGHREGLLRAYPAWADAIKALTRVELNPSFVEYFKKVDFSWLGVDESDCLAVLFPNDYIELVPESVKLAFSPEAYQAFMDYLLDDLQPYTAIEALPGDYPPGILNDVKKGFYVYQADNSGSHYHLVGKPLIPFKASRIQSEHYLAGAPLVRLRFQDTLSITNDCWR